MKERGERRVPGAEENDLHRLFMMRGSAGKSGLLPFTSTLRDTCRRLNASTQQTNNNNNNNNLSREE
ncbi:uncharacterized protein V6R79_014161 [Siganus canaliculatus]